MSIRNRSVLSCPVVPASLNRYSPSHSPSYSSPSRSSTYRRYRCCPLLRRSQHPLKSYEQGSVLVETSFVLPLLLFLTFGAVVLAKGLDEYVRNSRVAYEIARLVSSNPTVLATTHLEISPEVGPKISALMQSYGLSDASGVQVSAEIRELTLANTPSAVSRSLQIRVNTPFHIASPFGQLSPGTVQARITGPFLLSDTTP